MSEEIKNSQEQPAPEAEKPAESEKKPAGKVKKSWKMTRGEWILIGVAVVLCIIVALLNLRPQEAAGTLTVVSADGTEAEAEFDLILQRSLTKPGTLSGDITVNGVTYSREKDLPTGNEIAFFEGIGDMVSGRYDLPADFTAEDGSVLTLEGLGFAAGYLPNSADFSIGDVGWEHLTEEE